MKRCAAKPRSNSEHQNLGAFPAPEALETGLSAIIKFDGVLRRQI
jgi:hypothetical protein